MNPQHTYTHTLSRTIALQSLYNRRRYGCAVVFVGVTMPATQNTAAAAVGRLNPPTMQAVTLGAVDSIVHREYAAFCVPEDVILQGTVKFDGYANVLMEKTENNKAELAFQGKQEGTGKEFSVDVPLPVGPMKGNAVSHSHWNLKGGGVGQMKKGEIQFNPDHVSDGQHAFTLTRGQRYFVSTSAPLLRQQFELKLLKGKKVGPHFFAVLFLYFFFPLFSKTCPGLLRQHIH